MRVSVIVTTVNTPRLTRCLEALATTDPFEQLVIVADAPDESTWDILRGLARGSDSDWAFRLNHEPVGMPAAYNQGIEAADGDAVVLLASDAVVEKGWLRNMRLAAEQHPEFGWLAPRQIDGDGREHPMATFTCGMLTRKAIEELHMPYPEVEDVGAVFDPKFGPPGYGFEDDDVYWRMIELGFKPHGIEESVVSHPQSHGTLGSLHGNAQARAAKQVKGLKLIRERYNSNGTNWDALPVYSVIEGKDVREGSDATLPIPEEVAT